jgi:hypothetical protein
MEDCTCFTFSNASCITDIRCNTSVRGLLTQQHWTFYTHSIWTFDSEEFHPRPQKESASLQVEKMIRSRHARGLNRSLRHCMKVNNDVNVIGRNTHGSQPGCYKIEYREDTTGISWHRTVEELVC